MGEQWFWNFSQFSFTTLKYMTEEDMREIPYPATELGIHIAFKNFEAGSLIGGFIVAPLLPIIRKSGALAQMKLKHRIGICGRRGMLTGLILTPLMEYAFLKKVNVTEEGLIDRCYRLRYNKKQLGIDRSVLVFGLVGWAMTRWSGFVMGTNLAVIGGALYNAFLFDRMRNYKILGGDMMDEPDENYKPGKV